MCDYPDNHIHNKEGWPCVMDLIHVDGMGCVTVIQIHENCSSLLDGSFIPVNPVPKPSALRAGYTEKLGYWLLQRLWL